MAISSNLKKKSVLFQHQVRSIVNFLFDILGLEEGKISSALVEQIKMLPRKLSSRRVEFDDMKENVSPSVEGAESMSKFNLNTSSKNYIKSTLNFLCA